jgi:acetylglutamate kinase
MSGPLNGPAAAAAAPPVVVKLGGAALDEPAGAGGLWSALRQLHAQPGGVVVVHGGGAAVDRHLARLSVVSQRREGLRITPPEHIDDVVGVLAGSVNKRLVGHLQRAGAPAVGLCLGDGPTAATALLDANGFDPGRVGRVCGGDPALLRLLLAAGYLPVVSSIGLDAAGEPLNVNADDAAGGLARLLGASALLILTDVPGVLDPQGRLVALLRTSEIQEHIDAGRIRGGMAAKARSAAEAALGAGIPVTIASWKAPAQLRAALAGEGATRVVPDGAAAAAPRKETVP